MLLGNYFMRIKILNISIICIISFGFISFTIINKRDFQIFGQIYSNINTDEKFISLTFDDGPEPLFTDKILSILSNENIKCTFYLIGNEIKLHRNEAVKIIKDGHEIGNHSYSHNRMIFKSWNYIKSEIENTDLLINSIGYNGNITFRPPNCKKLFILPLYLKFNKRLTVTWNIEPDSIESISNNSLKMVNYVEERIQPGSIILMHVMNNNRIESMNSIQPMIKSLKLKGYKFLTVSELLKHNIK
jgi:peptidoglycan-N-acetylglucosamine deacetylase